jgi:hypothetical protein
MLSDYTQAALNLIFLYIIRAARRETNVCNAIDVYQFVLNETVKWCDLLQVTRSFSIYALLININMTVYATMIAVALLFTHSPNCARSFVLTCIS